MRPLVFALLLTGCAEPTSTQNGNPRSRDLGGHLQFQEDAGDTFSSKKDLGGGSQPDLAVPPDLAAAGNVDLAQLPGAPDMRCTAAVEDCFNDIDDDCNGKINDGCPDTVSVGAEVPLTAYGGGGGNAASARCPAGQAAIGLRIFFDDWDGWIAGVGVACSPLTLVRGATSYSVQVSMPTAVAASFYGSSWDSSEDDPCDTTKLQTVWTTITDTGSYVNGMLFNCGQGTVALSASNQLSITFSDQNNRFGWEYGGGAQHTQSCGASQVLVGYNGRIGGWLDQLQPVCAPLVVTYKP